MSVESFARNGLPRMVIGRRVQGFVENFENMLLCLVRRRRSRRSRVVALKWTAFG